MTVVERAPFEALGEQSRRHMIHDGLAGVHLEPNALVTHDMIAEWIGERFPIPRSVRGGEFVVPDYGPMDLVKADLLERCGVLLLPEANIGYRVATDAEMVREAEALWRKSDELLGKASFIARNVNRSRVDPADAERARSIERDVTEQQRVLRAKARERARASSKW